MVIFDYLTKKFCFHHQHCQYLYTIHVNLEIFAIRDEICHDSYRVIRPYKYDSVLYYRNTPDQ
jgi:hypothetical protein